MEAEKKQGDMITVFRDAASKVEGVFPMKVTGEEQDSYKSCAAGRRVEHWAQSDREVAESSPKDNFKTVTECMPEMAQAGLDLPWDGGWTKVVSRGPFLPALLLNEICDL